MASHTPFRPFLPAPDLLTWREMDERLEYDRGLSERVMGDTEARALLFAYEDGRTLAHWAAETSPAAALRAIRDPSIASLGAQSDWGSVAATAVHYHEAAALEALDNPAIYRLPAGHGGWVAHVALTYQEMARRKILENPQLATELDSRGRPLLFYAFSNHYEIAHRVCRSATLSAITDAEGNRMDEVALKRYPTLLVELRQDALRLQEEREREAAGKPALMPLPGFSAVQDYLNFPTPKHGPLNEALLDRALGALVLPEPRMRGEEILNEYLARDSSLARRLLSFPEARTAPLADGSGRLLSHWAVRVSAAAALQAVADPELAALGSKGGSGAIAAEAVRHHREAALRALEDPAVYRLPNGYGGTVAEVAVIYHGEARQKLLQNPVLAAERGADGKPFLYRALFNDLETARAVCRSALLSAITDGEGNRMDELAWKRYPALAPLRAEETSIQKRDRKQATTVEGSRGPLR